MGYVTPIDKEISFGENDFIVSKTNTKGIITYGNELFINISGYTEQELLGTPHNILRHPDMPKTVFALLWEQVQKGEEIFAYVKNLAKDGSYYWVFANVTPTMTMDDRIIGFHSVRRKPSLKAINTIKPLYSTLLNEEKQGGIETGKRWLIQQLANKGVSYDEFILSL